MTGFDRVGKGSEKGVEEGRTKERRGEGGKGGPGEEKKGLWGERWRVGFDALGYVCVYMWMVRVSVCVCVCIVG